MAVPDKNKQNITDDHCKFQENWDFMNLFCFIIMS